MFIFKKKEIHLDCFTDVSYIHEFYPITPAAQTLPDWWKKLPTPEFDFDEMVARRNMKYCNGFTDFHKNSISIRLWSDLAISLYHDGTNGYYKYQYANGAESLVHHDVDQFAGFLTGDYQHLKIKVPWIFKCKEDIDWVMVGNNWSKNLNDDLNVLPGVLNFKYEGNVNIQTVLKYDKSTIINKMYSQDTPLVNLFPRSDKKVVVHNHLVSNEELTRLDTMQTTTSFFRTYFKNKQKTKNKCPFH
jgi:hypothetical protein